LIYHPATTQIDKEIKETLVPKYLELPEIKGGHFSTWAEARKTIIEDKVRCEEIKMRTFIISNS
jgi:hypothetical protein